MSASIELNFFYFVQNIDRFQLSFQKDVQTINEEKKIIPIPEYVFKHGKDKSHIIIKLFQINTNISNEYNFYVYYGKNKAYVQLDSLDTKTYEIILKSIKNLIISRKGKVFNELDSIENTNKQRLVLINYESTCISINGDIYDLNEIVQNNCDLIASSYQLSEIDLKNKKFIVKPFEPKDECNLDFLINNKEEYQKFAKDLDDLSFCKNMNYIKRINEIQKNYKKLVTYDSINFHKTKEYLDQLFKSKNIADIDLFYNFFKCIFFFDYINMFIDNRTMTHCFLEKIGEIFEEIKEKDSIPIYDKIKALNTLFFTNDKLKNIDELNQLNIKYYFTSEIVENSILDRVFKFLNKFIDNLNENSAVYENFLFLDGGHGYYNKELVYTYDLNNLKMLKLHLKELLPRIIIFCYMKNDEIAFVTPEFGGMVINEFHLLKNYQNKKDIGKIDYNYPYEWAFTEEELNDISMNIVLNSLHENWGHGKYASVMNEIDSPKKIINKKNELIELKHIEEFKPNNNDDNSEYILTSKKPKGVSGHFLELGYGKVDNILITNLLFNMKNKGKLINRPDLFTDTGETLKQYVFLRKSIENKNIEFNFNNDMSIEEEIKEMINLIDKFEKEEEKKENEILNVEKNEGKIKLLTKKRKSDYIFDELEFDKKNYNQNSLKFNEIKVTKKDRDLEEKREEITLPTVSQEITTGTTSHEYNPNVIIEEINKKVEKKKQVGKKETKLFKQAKIFVTPTTKNLDKNSDNFAELTLVERIKNKTREEIIENAEKRIMEKFKFKYDETLLYNMRKKLKELDVNDPYFDDLLFVIAEYKKTV